MGQDYEEWIEKMNYDYERYQNMFDLNSSIIVNIDSKTGIEWSAMWIFFFNEMAQSCKISRMCTENGNDYQFTDDAYPRML